MSRHSKNANVSSPPWFTLENYDRQASLDLPGWLLQFGVRRDLLTFIEGQAIDPSQKGICIEIIEWIHSDPILQWERLVGKFGPAIQMIFPSLAPLHSPHPRNDMAVHPTTVEELYRAQMVLHPELRTHVVSFYDQLQEGIEFEKGSAEYLEELDNRVKVRKTLPNLDEERGSEAKVPHMPLMSQPLYCASSPLQHNFFFTINVALPDKLLETQMRNSVQRVRDYLATVANISTHLPTNPTEDWIDEQLLAYFDLSLEKYLPDGMSLSNAEIAGLIWPSERPGKASDKHWGAEHLISTTASLSTEMTADYSEAFWTLQATVAAILAKPSLDMKPPASLAATLKKPKTRRNRWKNK